MISRLKALNPSALDAEIRLLAPALDELEALQAALGGSGATSRVDPFARLSSFLYIVKDRYGDWLVV